MPFTIVRQDITKMKVDAIVNAANTELRMGGGVCGAIFQGAGPRKLQSACDPLAPIQTGEAVITPGFDLPAKFIIHTAGPVYHQWDKVQSEKHLRSAYTNSLKRAIENNCETIAFPLISSGIYGYPKEEALEVATSAIHDFLMNHDLEVTLVVYGKRAFSISQERIGPVESYIDEHFIKDQNLRRRQLLEVEQRALAERDETLLSSTKENPLLDDLMGELEESFSQRVLQLIDGKALSDVAVYKRANLDRKLFSKIRSNKDYRPSKRTAIALAIALELSLDETGDLLKRAGYALSHAEKFDVIIEYFIIHGKYNIFEINEVLFEYDQPLLGS